METQLSLIIGHIHAETSMVSPSKDNAFRIKRAVKKIGEILGLPENEVIRYMFDQLGLGLDGGLFHGSWRGVGRVGRYNIGKIDKHNNATIMVLDRRPPFFNETTNLAQIPSLIRTD